MEEGRPVVMMVAPVAAMVLVVAPVAAMVLAVVVLLLKVAVATVW